MSWASSALKSTFRGAARSLVNSGAARVGNFLRSSGNNAFSNIGRGPAKRAGSIFGGVFGGRRRISSTTKPTRK